MLLVLAQTSPGHGGLFVEFEVAAGYHFDTDFEVRFFERDQAVNRTKRIVFIYKA